MNNVKPKTVVFTDLDGTMLDRLTYSYEDSLPAIERLRQRGVPLVFCSAKTFAEQTDLRRELSANEPFIVENGAAIFIPVGYFSVILPPHRHLAEHLVIEFGKSYQEIRRILERIRREQGLKFYGYGDMTVAEVMLETGLDEAAAGRAMQRDYEETVRFTGSADENRAALLAIRAAGLEYARGARAYGVHGGGDKGKAATLLADIFRRELGTVTTVGIGDSFNDKPLLAAVDKPFLVRNTDGVWSDVDVPNLRRVAAIGPVGFRHVIDELCDRSSD
jgi:mannosyl-3-phosphoglycerate phosphatase